MIISVVVPVHNEAGTISGVVADLARELSRVAGNEWEVIVVDDASTDRLDREGLVRRNGVRVLTLAVRGGSGHARRIGTRAATGDWVGWIDGDGTYHASDLCRLLLQAGDADQVIGARNAEFGSGRLVRAVVKRATFAVASWSWRTRIEDLNSGIRVFRRERLLEFLDEIPDGFSCTSTATLASLNCGHAVVFLPVKYGPRSAAGRSKFHPLWDTWRLWRVVAHQWRRRAAKASNRRARDVSNLAEKA